MKAKIINIINNNKDISPVKKAELIYGLNCTQSFLEKFMVLLLLALLFNTFKVFMLIMLFFTPLRIFGFGYHAKTNFQCWVFSLFLYFLIPIFINIIKMPTLIVGIGVILASIIIIIFAPASSIKKPLKNKIKNRKRKLIIVFICAIYSLVVIFIDGDNLKECILAALTFEALLVGPFLNKPSTFHRALLNDKNKV